MHLDNNWYGHRSILANWCGVSDRPAFATILHGPIWTVGPERARRRIIAAPYLFWNEKHLREARFHSIPNTEAIGSPFMYLCKMKPAENPLGLGTLLFPQHHTDYNSAHTSHSRLIKVVEARFPPPYTVSLFFKEPNIESLRTLYEGKGWRIFTAGSRSNPEFLTNIRNCLNKNQHIVSNDFSTAILYGAYLGKQVQILHDELWERSVYYQHAADPAFVDFATALFDGVNGEAANKIAAEQLGESCMKPPEELRELLGWNSRWRTVAARLIARLVDMKYGSSIRRGDRDLANDIQKRER